MLEFNKKVEFFKEYLENNIYNCQMKEELFLYFFEYENDSLDFLEKFSTFEEIEKQIDLIISKMYMHEHQAGLIDIIESYC